jgi:hypothetical protein
MNDLKLPLLENSELRRTWKMQENLREMKALEREELRLLHVTVYDSPGS